MPRGGPRKGAGRPNRNIRANTKTITIWGESYKKLIAIKKATNMSIAQIVNLLLDKAGKYDSK